VASYHRCFNTQSIEQTYDVANEVQQCVLVDLFRTVGLTIATHVGRDNAESGLCKRLELMAPGVPGLRKAVAEDNQGPCALLSHMHTNAVRFDDSVLHLSHRDIHLSYPCCCGVGDCYSISLATVALFAVNNIRQMTAGFGGPPTTLGTVSPH
jgi:hypothetical protein